MHNKSLVKLNLSILFLNIWYKVNNKIQDAGMVFIGKALEKNNSIIKLKLGMIYLYKM